MPEDERTEKDQSGEEPAEELDAPPLRADNFVAFVASSWRTIRLRFGPVFLAFAISNLFINSIILAVSGAAETDTAAFGIIFLGGQFLLAAGVGGFVAVSSGYVRAEGFRGRTVSVLKAIRKVGDMWGHIIGASLLTGLVMAILFFSVGFMGFFLGLPFRLGPPVLLFVIAFEKVGTAAAWTRARELLKGNALRTYTYLLMLVLISLVILLAGQGLIGVGIDSLNMTDLGGTLIFSAVSVILYGLLDVGLSAGLLVTYVDCRARADEDFSLDDLVPETDAA